MAQQKGSTVSLAMGYETVAAGTVATDGFTLPVNSIGLKGAQTINSPATLTGDRNPVEPFLGNRDVSGSIVVPVDSNAMWYWCKAMFGDPTTTGTGPYTHEFSIGDTMPSLSFEEAFTDLAVNKYQRFLGCKISSFSMDFGGDGELTANVGVAGFSDSLENAAFDSTPTKITIARVNNFQAALTEGGSSLANAVSGSINIDFGLDTSQYVIGGGGVRGSLPEGIVQVSGRLTTTFLSDSLLAKAIGNTESSLKLTVTSSTSSIFEIEIQELKYARNSPTVSGPQGMQVELDFNGYYTDGSEASAVVFRVTNSEAHA